MLSPMLSDETYQETKDLFLGIANPSPLISEFAIWFYRLYDANLINFYFSVSNINKQDLEYRRLLLIVEKQTEKIYSSEINIDDRVNIKEKFIELSAKYNLANIQSLRHIDKLQICYFQYETQIRIIKQTLDEATIYLKKKYPEILWLETWGGNIAVIYHTDTQSDENEKKGINKTIMNDYFDFIKNYDETNVFKSPLTGIFVSQETLNRDFLGRLYYYMW